MRTTKQTTSKLIGILSTPSCCIYLYRNRRKSFKEEEISQMQGIKTSLYKLCTCLHQSRNIVVIELKETATLRRTTTTNNWITVPSSPYSFQRKNNTKREKKRACVCKRMCVSVCLHMLRSVSCKIDQMWERDGGNKEKRYVKPENLRWTSQDMTQS